MRGASWDLIFKGQDDFLTDVKEEEPKSSATVAVARYERGGENVKEARTIDLTLIELPSAYILPKYQL